MQSILGDFKIWFQPAVPRQNSIHLYFHELRTSFSQSLGEPDEELIERIGVLPKTTTLSCPNKIRLRDWKQPGCAETPLANNGS
jgi:hypothetical protein